ncbi:MAG: hypothetical protein PVG74_18830 [Desulfobacterales bacterium]|jgi:hypothetical protein
MNIAFLHYHLKTGGVTTVIKQQLAAIGKKCQTVVFTGLPPAQPLPAEFVHIPELGYSSQYPTDFNPDDVAETIFDAINQKFKGRCDVLHVHNPVLAKNRRFLEILNSLQKKNVPLFLQIHDFAEDGRPRDYFADAYPSNCHYGVVNQRDFDILRAAGLSENGLHLLANSVNPDPIGHLSPKYKLERPFVLYPVRAIRRKNVGEAILLSSFMGSHRSLAITLPPNSPEDKRSYQGWKAFVETCNLNVGFEKGLDHDFNTLVVSADSLVTTSITEGFGFSFLEPWLFNKLLWGRRLPDICRDFTDRGLRLDHLYTALVVPVDWIDRQRFAQRWVGCVRRAYHLFNLSIDEGLISQAFDSMTENDVIDFGILDETAQKEIIIHLISSKLAVEKLVRLNPFLSMPGNVSDSQDLVRDNRRVIEQNYNPVAYRQKLFGIYHKVAASPVEHRIDKVALAKAFLDLGHFSLLKWGDYLD